MPEECSEQMTTTYSLPAVLGGERVRQSPMPARGAFGAAEVAALMRAVEHYRSRQADPPYQGTFERQFCEDFAQFMGGGLADAVCSGTAAVYVALAALQLPKGSEVIVSGVTDSGSVSPIILLGHVPVVADTAPDSLNIGVEQFLARVTPRTKALIAVHCAGDPLPIDEIVSEARRRGILVLEDCSQAPGAMCKGQRVGSFGDIAAFSTMYRKTLAAGASGGVVYTRDPDLFHMIQAYADRGKQAWRTDLNQNDPGCCLFPSLNFNTDELSCAIGSASLARLQDSIDRRMRYLSYLVPKLRERSRFCTPYRLVDGMSPFFFPVFVDEDALGCTKLEFARALAAEGIDLNPHYGCVVQAWPWVHPYLADDFVTANALSARDRSFNLFLNENYGDAEAGDVVAAIEKIETYFALSKR